MRMMQTQVKEPPRLKSWRTEYCAKGQVERALLPPEGECAVQGFTVTGHALVALVQTYYMLYLLYENRQRSNLFDFHEIWTAVSLYLFIWEKVFNFATVPKVAKFRSKCKILASEL